MGKDAEYALVYIYVDIIVKSTMARKMFKSMKSCSYIAFIVFHVFFYVFDLSLVVLKIQKCKKFSDKFVPMRGEGKARIAMRSFGVKMCARRGMEKTYFPSRNQFCILQVFGAFRFTATGIMP